MAQVLHVPVQHPASRGLVKDRLVILGLREDRGWKQPAGESRDQWELTAKGREQVTKGHAPGKEANGR